MLHFVPDHDVSKVLTGETSFAEQAIRVGENVAISMARRPSTDPTSLLLSQRMEAALCVRRSAGGGP